MFRMRTVILNVVEVFLLIFLSFLVGRYSKTQEITASEEIRVVVDQLHYDLQDLARAIREIKQ